jgi:hypothetical protein
MVDHVLESRIALDPIVLMCGCIDIPAPTVDPISITYVEKPSCIPWSREVILVRLEVIFGEVK